MAAVTSCRKLLNINKIQYGHRFFVSTNQYGGRDFMHQAIQYEQGLLNVNNIQDGHRFFVWMNQYGGRHVMQKILNINKSNMAAFSLFQ